MSGSPGLSGSTRPVTAAQKSAEGIVAGSPAKARTTDRVSRTATLMRTRRQNIQLELALDPAAKGEARSPDTQGTEARTAHAEPERPETPSNRRVRTRTHGGVGGEEPRGSPLSRLRYGPAGDSAPRLRLKAAGERRAATSDAMLDRLIRAFLVLGSVSVACASTWPGAFPAADPRRPVGRRVARGHLCAPGHSPGFRGTASTTPGPP